MADRQEFAHRYLPTVRAYLGARWRSSPLLPELDDVVQEVFVALFRDGGALDRADSQNESGFRALLYAVTRNVALHAERTGARRHRRFAQAGQDLDRTPVDEATLSRVFDRAFAQAIMRQARSLMARRASDAGDDGLRRVELLRLRFEEGLAMREIAARLEVEPVRVHRDYARARREFRAALADTVAGEEGCPKDRLEQECDRLLALLRD